MFMADVLMTILLFRMPEERCRLCPILEAVNTHFYGSHVVHSILSLNKSYYVVGILVST